MRPVRLFVALVATSLSAPLVAHADPSPDDLVTATALYDEGVKLLAEKKYAEACPKLMESQRLDAGGGTLVAIALCHEGEGKLATAWADWSVALTQARAAGHARRMEAATEHITALLPRLPRLRIVVPENAPAGLEVTRAGAAIGKAQWGTALPIDTGEYPIEALVAGRLAWRTTAVVRDEGATVDVILPTTLEAFTTPEVVVAPRASFGGGVVAPRASFGRRKVIALVTGGTGLVAIGVGSYFGLTARSKWSDAQSNDCHNTTVCNAAGVQLAGDAKTDGSIGTVVFGAGVALVAAGAILWLTAPSSGSTALRAAPMVLGAGGGLVIGGAFQ